MVFQFNSDLIKSDDKFELVVPSVYEVLISNAEFKKTSSGLGMISLVFTIISAGRYEGRKVFMNMLTEHPKQQVVDISMQTLKRISIAAGVSKWDDVKELEGKFMKASLVHKENQEGVLKEVLQRFTPYNQESSFKSIKSNVPFTQAKKGLLADVDIPF